MKLNASTRQRYFLAQVLQSLTIKQGEALNIIRMTTGLKRSLGLEGPLSSLRSNILHPKVVNDVLRSYDIPQDQANFLLHTVLPSMIGLGERGLVLGELLEQLQPDAGGPPAATEVLPEGVDLGEVWTLKLDAIDEILLNILQHATELKITDDQLLEKLTAVLAIRKAVQQPQSA